MRKSRDNPPYGWDEGAGEKVDKRARCARLSGLRIRIRFLAALRAAYQAHGADVGRSEQARSSLRRSSAAPLSSGKGYLRRSKWISQSLNYYR